MFVEFTGMIWYANTYTSQYVERERERETKMERQKNIYTRHELFNEAIMRTTIVCAGIGETLLCAFLVSLRSRGNRTKRTPSRDLSTSPIFCSSSLLFALEDTKRPVPRSNARKVTKHGSAICATRASEKQTAICSRRCKHKRTKHTAASQEDFFVFLVDSSFQSTAFVSSSQPEALSAPTGQLRLCGSFDEGERLARVFI